jgi:hypothetical protein
MVAERSPTFCVPMLPQHPLQLGFAYGYHKTDAKVLNIF